MKIFFYYMRTFDELAYAEDFSETYGIGMGWSEDYPNPDNYLLAAGYDAVCITPCDMSAPVLERFAAMGIRYILCRSIGYDHVDLKRAGELGLRVANVSYPPSGVANFAVMLLLMLQRRIPQAMARAGVQDYSLKGKIGDDISFGTIGVIGTGRIGTAAICALSGFGCRILCHDPCPNEEAARYAEYVSLDELYAQSSAVTIHTNATADNYHLLDAQAFAKMQEGVLIVNTARGKLIDTAALIDALESGRVGGAALDVLENENGLYYYNRMGDTIDNRELAVLRSFPNVILSPHMAFYTKEAVSHMVRSCFDAARAFAQGTNSAHIVL